VTLKFKFVAVTWRKKLFSLLFAIPGKTATIDYLVIR